MAIDHTTQMLEKANFFQLPEKAAMALDIDRLVTGEELRLRLGVSPATMTRLRSAGELPPGFKVGPSWRYRAEDVRAWFENKMRAVAQNGVK